jgi:hypothetical protein
MVLTPPHKMFLAIKPHMYNDGYVRQPRFFKNCTATEEDLTYYVKIHIDDSQYFPLHMELSLRQGHMVKVIKVKVNLSLCLSKHHAMMAYLGSGGIAPCILDLSTRRR